MPGEPTAAADPQSGPTTEVGADAASNGHAPSTGAVTAGAAHPNPLRARVRRTVLAFVAILVLCVPFVVFAVINHEAAASSWAAWAGFTTLVTYVLGGRVVAYLTVGLLTALVPIALVVGAVPPGRQGDLRRGRRRSKETISRTRPAPDHSTARTVNRLTHHFLHERG